MTKKKKIVSIGVHAACKVDCPARLPLMVHAKLQGWNVEDPVRGDKAKRGSAIHAAFAAATGKTSPVQGMPDEEVIKEQIQLDIEESIPEITPEESSRHASILAKTLTDTVEEFEEPVSVNHEIRVSIMLTPLVKLTGYIDTVLESGNQVRVVERKSGRRQDWHDRQARVYADILASQLPNSRVFQELWYSSGPRVLLERDHGVELQRLRLQANEGEKIEPAGVMELLSTTCRPCTREDCGIKRLTRVL